MSVYAFVGAKGSPGTTTLATVVAATWPRRAVMAEADESGGDLAVRFGLSASPGLATLAAEARRSPPPESTWRHTQRLPGGLEVLVGPTGPAQAAAIVDLWDPLAQLLDRLDADVMVDLGRMSSDLTASFTLCRAADGVVLVCRAEAASACHARTSAEMLRSMGVSCGLAVVGERPYAPADVARAVESDLIAVIADDVRAARIANGGAGRPGTLRRSPLLRSATQLGASLVAGVQPTALSPKPSFVRATNGSAAVR
jgi:MinD-like ATPase involved in chromosome partitioning or flagellar assembly